MVWDRKGKEGEGKEGEKGKAFERGKEEREIGKGEKMISARPLFRCFRRL